MFWICYHYFEIGEATHYKKRDFKSFAKGMTPIEKNIRVVDEQGNELEATYPKRAKGLVKNGRARFIDETTICLACPPDHMEEQKMSDKQNYQIIEDAKITAKEALEFQTAFEEEMAHLQSEQDTQTAKNSYSIEYALAQLENIRIESKAFTEKLFEMLEKNKSEGPGDIGAQANAVALQELAKEHAATMRQQLDFYQKMANELKPQSAEQKETKFLDFVVDCCGASGGTPDFSAIWKMMTE